MVVVVRGTVVDVAAGAAVVGDVDDLINAVVGVTTGESVDPPPDGIVTNVELEEGTEVAGATVVVADATVVVVEVDVVVVVGATLYTPKLKVAVDDEDAPLPLSTRRAVMV